jgi:hypothetical protein
MDPPLPHDQGLLAKRNRYTLDARPRLFVPMRDCSDSIIIGQWEWGLGGGGYVSMRIRCGGQVGPGGSRNVKINILTDRCHYKNHLNEIE